MDPCDSLSKRGVGRCTHLNLMVLTCLMSTLLTPLQAQVNQQYFDGPYIFQSADSIEIKWVERGLPCDTTIARKEASVFRRDSLPVVDLRRLQFPRVTASRYDGVKRVVAISDVHGQYPLMRELMLRSGVIDKANNWALGRGHFVVNGDIFDRGDDVLEILWLLFDLEQQARAQGGRIHFLLGNHEQMVLQGDLRYLNRKYYYTAGVLRTRYHELFAQGSILGDWIAQHQVVISINDHLFVHAGISPEVAALGLSLDELNSIFREQMVRQLHAEAGTDSVQTLLSGFTSPLWYRGYFGEEALSKSEFKRLLKSLGQKKMIVGHTSQEEILALYDGRLIVIDCNIKLGQEGQVLVMERDRLYIIDQDGEQMPITRVK